MQCQDTVVEQFKKDERFFIDKRNMERLTVHKIMKYDVLSIEIGKILRDLSYRGGGIVNLCDTYVYAYLDDEKNGGQKYQEYCNICNVSFRSKGEFDRLISNLSVNGYDISKGAICIDQNNLILEGQHRACIILKKYGAHYKIPVVKISYREKISFGYAMKLFVARIKNKIYMMRH